MSMMEIVGSARDQILIIDDEPLVCDLVAKVVERAGYIPRIFNHPQDVLAAPDVESAKLAFIDINMPEMDGIALSEVLKAKDPFLDVVIMTWFWGL